jgi:hypothetical protein
MAAFWEPPRLPRGGILGRAMSQQNVEVVRRIERAFNKGDIDALVAELHPRLSGRSSPYRASIPFTTATRASGRPEKPRLSAR